MQLLIHFGKKISFAAGLALFLVVQPGWCVTGLNPDGSLDKETISKFYFDGDFDTVIDALETFRKNNPSPSDEDKVFMYKYLCVIYVSRPDSRDKGESYMYQLLKLVPTIDLLDMYISDNIEAIFLRVKERYQRMEGDRQERAASENDGAEVKPSSDQAAGGADQKEGQQKDPKIKNWVWWTAGGVAVASLVTIFLVSSGDDPPETNTISNYE